MKKKEFLIKMFENVESELYGPEIHTKMFKMTTKNDLDRNYFNKLNRHLKDP